MDAHDETGPIDIEMLQEMFFGGTGDDRVAFDVTWVDHFWDREVRGQVLAGTIEEAVDLAEAHGPDGMTVDRVDGEGEQLWSLSGGHEVRDVRLLLDTDDGLLEEEVTALTLEMAIDLAGLLFGPTGRLLGVQEDATLMWLEEPEDEFFDREDLPIGWRWTRRRR